MSPGQGTRRGRLFESLRRFLPPAQAKGVFLANIADPIPPAQNDRPFGNRGQLMHTGRSRRGGRVLPSGFDTGIVLTAATALAGAGLSFVLLPLPAAWFGAALAVIAVLIAAVDVKRLIIPDSASAALFALGLGLTVADATPGEGAAALLDALSRASAGFLAFLALRVAYRRISGQDGLGFGDVKLAGAGAVWLSWSALPVAVELAVLTALLTILGRALACRAGIDRSEALPFGAFLAPALWISFVADRLGFLEFVVGP